MKAIIEHISYLTQLLGQPVPSTALTSQSIHTPHGGLDFHSLSEILRTHGFDNTLSQRPLEDIPSLAVPVLVILKDEQAAVITKIEGSGDQRIYHIRQNDGLEQVKNAAELNALYLGYAWFIKPRMASDVRSELPEYEMPKAWFWKVIWRFRSYYYQVILATFVINFLALVSSLYVMNVYDRVIPNQAYQTLWVLSIGVVIAIGFEFMAKMIRAHLTDIAGKKADLIISSALFRRVMALDMEQRPASAGSYANNLRDFESVRDFMTSASLLVLVDLPFVLLFVTVIALVGGKLALVPLTIIPLVILMGFLVQPRLSKYINESMRESSQRQGLAVEAIEGIETLKTNNANTWAQQRWDAYTAKTSASSIKVKDLSNLVVNFSTCMQQLNTVFLVLVGTYLIHNPNPDSKITMGALIASVILSGRALAPLAQIAGLATRYQQAVLAFKGVQGIIERKIDRDTSRNYITLNPVLGHIQFSNVGFKYQQDGPAVLKDINLSIKAGEKVAIIGRIGSGKSTLLKLASGIYEAKSGNVTLDNIDIRQIDPNFMRNQVALLGQSPRLFLGTLRENLELARMDNFSGDQVLIDALRRFGLDRIIRNHPRGLDMPLGEDGMGLSGGQKQIIALARLTLRDPRVVLLDEPTTGLDQNSEIQVLQALAQWCRHRTLVVVTHRPQVLQIVDRIVVVDEGRVVMHGPRDAVLKKLVENDAIAQEQKQKMIAAQQAQQQSVQS